MAYSQEFRERAEAALSAVLPITSRPMFGGVGIYSEGIFFALIADAKLYFKVDETNRADYEQAGMQPFFPFDSPKPMHYWEVPDSVLTTSDELLAWASRAIAVAQSKKR